MITQAITKDNGVFIDGTTVGIEIYEMDNHLDIYMVPLNAHRRPGVFLGSFSTAQIEEIVSTQSTNGLKNEVKNVSTQEI